MSLLVVHHPAMSSCKFVPCLESLILCCRTPPSKTNTFISATPHKHSSTFLLTQYSSIFRNPTTPPHHVLNCSSNNEVIDEIHFQENNQEIGLLGKPSPKPPIINVPPPSSQDYTEPPPDKDQVLEPFYKFFRDGKSDSEVDDDDDTLVAMEVQEDDEEDNEEVSVEYYDPQQGDFVVGVVVSGNEYKLDVNIGADLLASMLTKEVLPLYHKELDFLLCDIEENADDFMMMNGKMGIVEHQEALSSGPGPGQPVVEHGTVLFAEVLGRTLSGRPLISTRRLFRRLAWHRVRRKNVVISSDNWKSLSEVIAALELKIKLFNEPIEVKITEWNTGGLLTRIEGLRAFLPKNELVNRVNNFTELKENVGRRMYVQITRISEDTNDLILSQKEAWNATHLKEGTLLEGTVRKIFPYGAQIRIGETNRSGLLHISNITRGEIVSISDVLAIDEKVKVLVVKSMFPDKISLSTAELESEPGLFLRNKEKVYLEAAEMGKKYRQKLPAISTTRKLEHLPSDGRLFGDEESMYANWNWFKFQRDEPK